MKEIRPGIIRIRKARPNKIENLKKSVLSEKSKIEQDIAEKYKRGEEAVYDLREFASDVSDYITILKDRGIDVDYIRENAQQIKYIFFAVLELIENGHKGFEGTTKEKGEETNPDSNGPAAKSHVKCQ
jgi:hypothetical protein